MLRILQSRPGIGILAACAALASACAGGSEITPPADPRLGKAAPPFVFHNVHKRLSFPSSNFKGKNLVLVFIRPGQPNLQLLLREIEKMRLDPTFVSVSFVVMAPENDPFVKPFWIGIENSLDLALDYTGVAERYGAGSLPLVVVRDFRETVRLRLDGFAGRDLLPRLRTVRRTLKDLEQERANPSAAGR